MARVPLQLSGSILHQGRWWWVIEKLDMEGYFPIPYPLWSCNCDSVPWIVMVVIQSTVWWHLQAEDVYPSTKCTRSCRHLLPLHITWSLHPSSVDSQADIHGRSHNFPLILPQEVLLAWYWMVARPLSTHGVISFSLPLGVGLTWVGLVHLSHAWQTPTHRGMPVSDTMRRRRLQCRMHDCPHWFIIWKGTSIVFLLHHLMRFILPPVLNLSLSLKVISLH